MDLTATMSSFLGASRASLWPGASPSANAPPSWWMAACTHVPKRNVLQIRQVLRISQVPRGVRPPACHEPRWITHGLQFGLHFGPAGTRGVQHLRDRKRDLLHGGLQRRKQQGHVPSMACVGATACIQCVGLLSNPARQRLQRPTNEFREFQRRAGCQPCAASYSVAMSISKPERGTDMRMPFTHSPLDVMHASRLPLRSPTTMLTWSRLLLLPPRLPGCSNALPCWCCLSMLSAVPSVCDDVLTPAAVRPLRVPQPQMRCSRGTRLNSWAISLYEKFWKERETETRSGTCESLS